MSEDIENSNEDQSNDRKRSASEDSGASSSSSSEQQDDDDDDNNQATNSILIIEDFAMTSKILSNTLKYCRSAVCTSCKNAIEALEKIEKHGAFDLILTDIMMKPITGIEFIVRVRAMEKEKDWKPQMILAMSADESNSHAALDAGATLFVAKFSSPMTKVLSILDDLRNQTITMQDLLQRDIDINKLRRESV